MYIFNTKVHPLINCIVHTKQHVLIKAYMLTLFIYYYYSFILIVIILQMNYFAQPAIAYPCVCHQVIVLWHLNIFHKYLQLLL